MSDDESFTDTDPVAVPLAGDSNDDDARYLDELLEQNPNVQSRPGLDYMAELGVSATPDAKVIASNALTVIRMPLTQADGTKLDPVMVLGPDTRRVSLTVRTTTDCLIAPTASGLFEGFSITPGLAQDILRGYTGPLYAQADGTPSAAAHYLHVAVVTL